MTRRKGLILAPVPIPALLNACDPRPTPRSIGTRGMNSNPLNYARWCAMAYLLTPEGIHAKLRLTRNDLTRKEQEYIVTTAEIDHMRAALGVDNDRREIAARSRTGLKEPVGFRKPASQRRQRT